LKKNENIFKILKKTITADELIEMTMVSGNYQKTFFDVFRGYKSEQFLKIRKNEQLKSKTNIEESIYGTYLKREKNILKHLREINKLKILYSIGFLPPKQKAQ